MTRKIKLLCWVTAAALAIFTMQSVYSSYSLADMEDAIAIYSTPILACYIVLIAIRGVLFIPTMPVILIMASVLDNLLILAVTLIATCVSSYLVCLAVDHMDFHSRIRTLPSKSVRKAQYWIQSYGIIAIAGWAFFPFVFTEIIVYLARAAGISKQQIVLSVALGEGFMLCILVYITDWFINLTF